MCIPFVELPEAIGYSRPALGDLDDDGDLDAVLWSPSYYKKYYRNDGTPDSPDFNQISEQFISQAFENSLGQFVDLDSDGDLDIIESNYDGRVFYWENSGTPQNLLL